MFDSQLYASTYLARGRYGLEYPALREIWRAPPEIEDRTSESENAPYVEPRVNLKRRFVNKAQYGVRLQIARQRQRMRQIDVAIALEEYGLALDQTAIGKIERGKRIMGVHELAVFAEVLEVPVEWLVNGGPLEIS